MIAALVFLIGVVIRHYFNSMHARKGQPNWTWLAAGLLFLAIIWLSAAGVERDLAARADGQGSSGIMTREAEKFASAEGFDQVNSIVMGRCSMCHGAEPFHEGIVAAPRGVLLDTPAHIAAEASRIYLHAGLTKAMPPANVSFIEPSERAAIRAWYRAATSG